MRNLKSLSILALATVAVSAQAGHIFGLAQQGGIYRIDVNTGDATLLLNAPSGGGTRGRVNGLAHDGNGTFYYANGSQLIRHNNFGSTALGTISGPNANATFHNGQYTFVSGRNALRSINVSDMSVTNRTLSGALTGFGDIASDASGKVWSSVVDGRMQTFNLNNTAAGTANLATRGTEGLQLGFDGLGNLFGISYDTSKIYAINMTTGARTWTGGLVNSGEMMLNITDAASAAPVPEPASLAALGAGALALIRRRKANKSA